jgi:hypothetical protein
MFHSGLKPHKKKVFIIIVFDFIVRIYLLNGRVSAVGYTSVFTGHISSKITFVGWIS